MGNLIGRTIGPGAKAESLWIGGGMAGDHGREPAGVGKTGVRKERVRYPVAPPDNQGPGAERKIMVILILLLVCAVLGVAAGVMVVVSRNAQGGTPTPDAGALLPICALIF